MTLTEATDQLQRARADYKRAKERLTNTGQARAFRLLEEARKRHPEWVVKRSI